MPKALCIVGIAVAILLFVAFGLDLVIDFPFGKAHFWMDICFLVCSVVLGYLSWATLREQV